MIDAEARERTLRLLEEATQAPEGSLGPERVLRDLDGWDSMGMVMFIGLVKERFGFELSVHDLRRCDTVGDLHARVDAGRKA
jgi:acyl carrier protein